MKVPASTCYNKTMKTAQPDPSIKSLYNRLYKVNTQLNLIEEGWPFRQPNTRRSTLKVDHPGCKLPKYAVDALRANGERLLTTFPKGWEFTVRGFTWGGRDGGCIMEIFVNGQAFASIRWMVGDAAHLKTPAQCTQECVDGFSKLTTNAIARLVKYPERTFKSKKYARLCELRRQLNRKWHSIPQTRAASVPGPWAYPYGDHKPGWPVFEGMQLGK